MKLFLIILLACSGLLQAQETGVIGIIDCANAEIRDSLNKTLYSNTNDPTLLKIGDKVWVYSFLDNSDDIKIKYHNTIGIINSKFIDLDKLSIELIKNRARLMNEGKKIEDQLKKDLKLEEARQIKEITKIYGKKFAKDIYNRVIRLGMSKKMVKASWGAPDKVSRTVGIWGVHEQWVYGNNYLYFENDKLTSWQEDSNNPETE